MCQYFNTIFSLHYDIKHNDKNLAIIYKFVLINFKKLVSWEFFPLTTTI